MTKDNWTREQTIVALNLYCKIPFNRVASKHPDIMEVAKIIGRSPNAVKMKIGNFGSFDPELKRRGIVGLANTSNLDKEIWAEFNSDWDGLAYESEKLLAKFTNKTIEEVSKIETADLPIGKEREAIVRVRVNQSFFRATILSSYNMKCCITGLSMPELLVASHIVPWAKDEKNRLNPHNGLCLNPIHDKAFDKGLITVTRDYKIKVSKSFEKKQIDNALTDLILKYDNAPLIVPDKFMPDQDFLSYHQKHIFRK